MCAWAAPAPRKGRKPCGRTPARMPEPQARAGAAKVWRCAKAAAVCEARSQRGTVRSRWRRESGALCAPERGTNSLPFDSAVSSAPFAAANPLARRARGFFAPSARSAGTESPQAATPASIYIFSLLHIRTNVLMLNLHKTYAEISLFYLNLCGNIFVAFSTLWWYN